MGEAVKEPDICGWLYKWTNYLRGYQKRWFVLQNGLLSYYRSQGEMSHTCRGAISLHGALIYTEDSCNLVVSTNGGTQTFHLRASSEVERQRWVTSLELAKAKAIRLMESEEEEELEEVTTPVDSHEVTNVFKMLNAKHDDLKTCCDLINKHGNSLTKALSELECMDSHQDIAAKVKQVNERATLFRITSTAMINACAEFAKAAQTQGKKWQKAIQFEKDQRIKLEKMVEELAQQHRKLEEAAAVAQQQNNNDAERNMSHKNVSVSDDCQTDDSQNQIDIDDVNADPKKESVAKAKNKGRMNVSVQGSVQSDEDDETVYYDAVETSDQGTEFMVDVPISSHRRTSSGISVDSQKSEGGRQSNSSSDTEEHNQASQTVRCIRSKSKSAANEDRVMKVVDGRLDVALAGGIDRRIRRKRLPEQKPNYPLNLWSIMKNCIGKDLTKIPMPVNFSEPLSMLQRLTEDFEYSEILDKAAQCTDSCEQLSYVAAFTVSAYATTSVRTGKPFNPLLGETYECDRTDDMGWRCLNEQVSHHPPMAAQYCEGRGWECWQEFTMSSKFRGKYLQIIPMGIAHLRFNSSGNHYTWRKVTTTIHNIIVGKLWVDHHGEMEITNHANGDKCHLKYIPYSYFNRDVQRKVSGCVMDRDDNVKYVLSGTWDTKIEGCEVLKVKETDKSGKPTFELGPSKTLWSRQPLPDDAERYYFFTEFACQLNEQETDVAPSDTRIRPDQRLMEEAKWDDANVEKVRLEEKQRANRRKRELEAEQAASEGRPFPPYEPVWFAKEKDAVTGHVVHKFKKEMSYWKCKEKGEWSKCPDIF